MMNVQLVGQMSLDRIEIQEFLKAQGEEVNKIDFDIEDNDLAPEIAGRICYMSFSKPRPGGNAGYLEHIKEVGHGSVLEHAVYSFIISGVSRILTHELVRHRAGMAYSQLSQRYVDESERAMVIPHDIPTELIPEWEAHVLAGKALYVKTTEMMADSLKDRTDMDRTEKRKTARQSARYILPHGMETIIYMTANGRALRHILEMRGSKMALPEIRMMALKCLQLVSDQAMFADYKIEDNVIETEFPKV